MGIVGKIILGILLCIALANLAILCACLRIEMQRRKRYTSRKVQTEKIPADWDRIVQETTLEKKRRTK
jgi:hypothetical protein